MPAELDPYLHELVARLRETLGHELVGVYLGGSACLGGYSHGRSDVDVAVVSRGALSRATKERLVGKLRHESLPCPARGLELVVYPEAAVVRPTAEPAFELELNSGSNMPELVAFDSAERPASLGTHWYVIDRAIVSERGIPLAGPPAPEVFAPVPRELVLPTLAESLRWHALDGGSGSRPDDAVLNACRALRYAAGAGWASKPEAGRWALRRFGPDELISRALHERQRGEAARR